MTQEFKKGDRVEILPINVMYAGERGVITSCNPIGTRYDGGGATPLNDLVVKGKGEARDVCRVKLDKDGTFPFPISELKKL